MNTRPRLSADGTDIVVMPDNISVSKNLVFGNWNLGRVELVKG